MTETKSNDSESNANTQQQSGTKNGTVIGFNEIFSVLTTVNLKPFLLTQIPAKDRKVFTLSLY